MIINRRRMLAVAACVACLSAAAPSPPQWPPAPEPARVRFIETVTGARPASGKMGAFLRGVLGLGKNDTQPGTRLVRPTGLFIRDQILFVADPGARGVLRYSLDTGKGEWWPRGARAKFVSPVGVSGSADGRLYVSDSALKKVFILDETGHIRGELKTTPQAPGQPAMVSASDDRVYVSDIKNHRIAVYGLGGEFQSYFGRRGLGPAEFNFPTYMWSDPRSHQLWINDSGNFRVQWTDADGTSRGQFGRNGNHPGFLARPRGLARDSQGHIYVVDAAFDAFQVFDELGRLLLFVGRSGSGEGEFNLPGGLAIDGSDKIYVADTQNARVQVFQYFKESNP